VEGCGYRDHQQEFSALGVDVVAVGFDSPTKDEAWAEAEGFDFEVWTDDHTLALYYGAATSPTQSHPTRLTFILDADGNEVLEYHDVNLNLGEHPARVLHDCGVLFGDHRP